jgi:protein-tyrosine phosphatase
MRPRGGRTRHPHNAEAPREQRPGEPEARLLVVCTANICRSPLAEAMLVREARRRRGPQAPVRVASSGVHGLRGQPAAPRSVAEADRRGLDLRRHLARVTDATDVAESDLVITMTALHRRRVVRLCPGAAPYTFTLAELARLVAELPQPDGDPSVRERVRWVARRGHEARAGRGPEDVVDDVDDPYGGPQEDYAVAAERIEALVMAVAHHLFGPLPDEPA